MMCALELLSMTAVSLFAQTNLAGAWTISGDVQGYPINESCAFTQDKDKISGPCKNAEGKSFDTSVTIKDQTVVFVHGGDYQGEKLTLTFTGRWNDKGELSGAIDA